MFVRQIEPYDQPHTVKVAFFQYYRNDFGLAFPDKLEGLEKDLKRNSREDTALALPLYPANARNKRTRKRNLTALAEASPL